MSNANDARKAHKILDDLLKGNIVLDEEREFLRSALPEPPKQKTLEELKGEVVEAFLNTTGDTWGDDDVYLKDWLGELHAQLKGLEDAATTEPAHPEFLETEADYQNAPEGTIVAYQGLYPWVKLGDRTWEGIGVDGSVVISRMCAPGRRVLRWGLGE